MTRLHRPRRSNGGPAPAQRTSDAGVLARSTPVSFQYSERNEYPMDTPTLTAWFPLNSMLLRMA
jgi:hypothetical protein